ncbi:MAG: hypothetical protein ACJ8D8_20215, partial [Microvirga sp.]
AKARCQRFCCRMPDDGRFSSPAHKAPSTRAAASALHSRDRRGRDRQLAAAGFAETASIVPIKF